MQHGAARCKDKEEMQIISHLDSKTTHRRSGEQLCIQYVMILTLKYKRKQIFILFLKYTLDCKIKIKPLLTYINILLPFARKKIFGSRPINDLFFAALIKVQMQETWYGRSNEVSWSAYSFFDLIFALCSRSHLK